MEVHVRLQTRTRDAVSFVNSVLETGSLYREVFFGFSFLPSIIPLRDRRLRALFEQPLTSSLTKDTIQACLQMGRSLCTHLLSNVRS